MFATQVITNNGEEDVVVDDVSLPEGSGQAVADWFLVGMDEYRFGGSSSPDIPPRPDGSTPSLAPGETKRVAVLLEVTSDHTTEDHLTIEYHEDGGRTGTLTPARRLLAMPHGQECP